jgi:hypothetical protein
MKYSLIFGFIFSALVAFGQNGEALRKIEAARIALITERLELTPDQAEKFWPIYREYTQQRLDLRKELQALKRNADTNQLTDAESKEVLEKGQLLKERQLALDKTYTEKLSTVISNNQILALRKAEEDFKQMIIRRLEQRRDNRDRMDRRDGRKLDDDL